MLSRLVAFHSQFRMNPTGPGVDRLRADLARDQRALDRQLRDIHRDRVDIYRDQRDRW